MARIGLRMMPTFPWPPLKFRTAGFPRYGLKAGYRARPSPLPGLLSPFVLATIIAIPCSVSGTVWSTQHLHASGSPLCPRGPRSDRVMLSRPSPLNWPHAPHSPVHPDFAAARFIQDAFAVPDLRRPRQPTSGSELSSMLIHNMSSSTTTGNSSAACTQYLTEDPSLQLRMTVSAFPSSSHSDSGEGLSFRGFTTVRLRYDLLCCLPSWSEQTGFASSHRESVYFRASDGLVTRSAAGYHYRANWAICTSGTFTRKNID